MASTLALVTAKVAGCCEEHETPSRTAAMRVRVRRMVRGLCALPANLRILPFNVCGVGHLDSQRSLPVIGADRTGFSPLAKKLRLTPGSTVLVLNAPEGCVERLRPGPADIQTRLQPNRDHDAVLLFVRDVAELQRLGPAAMHAARAGGLLWIAYPKGGQTKGATDLPATPWWVQRDVLGEITAERGYKPVSFVAVDDVWTALRFKRV
jgi:hypothetical protein